MATDVTAPPATGPTIPVEKLPVSLRPITAEINALLGEMPRLLDDRQDGRFVVQKIDRRKYEQFMALLDPPAGKTL